MHLPLTPSPAEPPAEPQLSPQLSPGSVRPALTHGRGPASPEAPGGQRVSGLRWAELSELLAGSQRFGQHGPRPSPRSLLARWAPGTLRAQPSLLPPAPGAETAPIPPGLPAALPSALSLLADPG